MSGFEPTPLSPASVARPKLPAYSFDLPDIDGPAVGRRAKPDPAAAAEAAIAARLAVARAEGATAGAETARAELEAGLRSQEMAALAAILATLEAGRADLALAAEAAATALARILLAALDAALPEAAARLMPDTVARLAEALRPLIEDGVPVTLRVAPGTAAAAAARITDPGFGIEEDAGLTPGDAAAAWRGGGANVSLAARRAAIAALLATFDLSPKES